MAEVSVMKLPSDEYQWTLLMIKSTLVQVMAWAIRQQAITWTNVDPVLCRHMASLGHNELISNQGHRCMWFCVTVSNQSTEGWKKSKFKWWTRHTWKKKSLLNLSSEAWWNRKHDENTGKAVLVDAGIVLGNERTWVYIVNTLRPRQNGRHFADDILKCISLNENVWILLKISLKFVPKALINNIPALVRIMAWHRPGDKSSSEPMMGRLLMPICFTQLNELRWQNI